MTAYRYWCRCFMFQLCKATLNLKIPLWLRTTCYKKYMPRTSHDQSWPSLVCGSVTSTPCCSDTWFLQHIPLPVKQPIRSGVQPDMLCCFDISRQASWALFSLEKLRKCCNSYGTYVWARLDLLIIGRLSKLHKLSRVALIVVLSVSEEFWSNKCKNFSIA